MTTSRLHSSQSQPGVRLDAVLLVRSEMTRLLVLALALAAAPYRGSAIKLRSSFHPAEAEKRSKEEVEEVVTQDVDQHRGAEMISSYLTACSRSDPNLNECVIRNGKAAIPAIINGDPKYRVPNMNPMVIPELALWQGTSAVGLKLAWKNAQIHGLKDAEFRECDMNVTTKHTKLTFFAPKISITGIYSASGRVLILPVTGSGPSNITVLNMKISFDYDWPVSKRANGKEYIDIINHKMTLHDLGFMQVKFDNLFNGDRLLGDNMNNFINENWKEVSKEFGPGVADAIGEVFKLVLKNICDLVPYDVVFKP